jgi:hypothetical protein
VRPGTGGGQSAPYQGFTSVGPSWETGNDDLSQGLTGTDFLGQVRNLPVPDRLSSVFPGTWLAGRSAGSADDRAEYLGFTYVRSDEHVPAGGLYYTGERYDGKRIYVPASGYSPPGMPHMIFLRNGDSYVAYSLSGEPSVYAYVLYGAFNTNESVRFGLVNNGGDSLDLMNSAPFEIQQREGGAWHTVFSPVAAQVIVPMSNGTSREWQWNQHLDNDTLASFGDYRVLVSGRYAASFRLAPDTPAVERSLASYEKPEIASLADVSTVSRAFGKAYPSPSADTRKDIVSIMQFKARALGLDAAGLGNAINATGVDAPPCLAIYAQIEGRPSWIIAFSQGARATAMSGTTAYVVDESSKSIPRITADL